MNKKLIGIIITLSILVRFVLALITYHPDLSVFVFAGKIIVSQGHWLNFYNYGVQYVNGVATLFPHGMVLNYQPLAYLLPSIFYLPFFTVLKHTADAVINGTWNHSALYLPLLVYKLPMLTADISIIYLLPKLFSEKNKNLTKILWAINPIAIYVSSMLGQVDIFIALFLILGLICVKKNRFHLAAVSIAASALIKPAAVILLPVLVLYLFYKKRSYLYAITNLAFGVGTYFLGIFPYVFSPIYRHYALFADQVTKSTYAGISIASGHDIPWFFIVYAIVIALVIYKKIDLIPALGAALLSSLAFTHFHPQWLLWLTPWFIYFAFTKNNVFPLMFTYLSWLIILLSFDTSLNLGLFYLLNIPKSYLLPTISAVTSLVSLSRAWIVAYLLIHLQYSDA